VYSRALVTIMGIGYHIEPSGNAFIAIDPSGEQVGTYPTEDAARQAIERCKQNDALYSDAGQLLYDVVNALMQKHSVGRETALYWVRIASETLD